MGLLEPLSASTTPYGIELQSGFETLDGIFVSNEEYEAALHKGLTVLVGGLLVSSFGFC